ncbi:MAG TPA: hypothetical protein VGO11_08795 [Chthoniobacteraceae bacterium]|jgi:hypothetical protein|nr:hypothetical protein [Chthoniobacteraceae bacterium]
MLIFVVALQSPLASRDWGLVSRLWERTLRSICAQTCGDFRVFLVCNERPAIGFAHPAVTVVEGDFPLPGPSTAERMQDKWLKLKHGLVAARSLAPAHVFIMDADDCVHRGLAALCAAHPGEIGWRFYTGYVRDEGSRWLFLRRDFDTYCGTSAIVRAEPADLPGSVEEPIAPYFLLTHGHGAIGEYLRERGTPLRKLPFIGAIYNTATGENDSGFSLRGWRSRKVLLRKLLNSRPLTWKIRREFGLYELEK